MLTFEQWLLERGKRTSLGIYPALYGVSSRPPLDYAPTSAGHLNAFARIHGGVHPELLNDPIRQEYKGKKEKKLSNGANVSSKKDNPYKSFYNL